MHPDRVLDFLLKMKPIVIAGNKLLVEPRFKDPNYGVRIVSGHFDPKAYVTVADKHLDFMLVYVSELLGMPAYGEESPARRADVIKNKTYSHWDGVDGTGGYVEGLYESCGTIGAVIHEGEAVGAIAYAPETRALSIATKWHESIYEVDGVPQEQAKPADYIIFVHRTEAWNPKLDWFLEWLGRKKGIRVEVIEGGGPGSFGAAHFKYPYTVFSGTVGNGNWKEWDVAGPRLILETADSYPWHTSDMRGHRHTLNNVRPNYDYGFLATRLDHIGIRHGEFVRYLLQFTEEYKDELVLPDVYDNKGKPIKMDDKMTVRTVLVTDQIYTAFKHSERLRLWKVSSEGVPSEERHRLLERKVLVP